MKNHPESNTDFELVMDFLYSIIVLMNLLIIGLAGREFYLYWHKIKMNRKWVERENIKDFKESLLDCKVIEGLI